MFYDVFHFRMELRNVANFAVVMVTCAAADSLSCLLSMFLPVHMKVTTLSCSYR